LRLLDKRAFAMSRALWSGSVLSGLGWFAGKTIEDAHQRLLALHRWFGISATPWSVATLWASEHATDTRAVLRCLIACAALLVAGASYFGGEVVHYAQACADGVR